MKSKIEELLQMLKTQPDVIALSESKLNENNVIRADFKNYNFVHCDSLSNAGGVGLYISSSLSYSKIDEHSWATFHSESLFVEIKLENTAKNLVIGVIYRHPSSSLSDFQNQFTQTHNKLPESFSFYFNVINNIHPHVFRSTTRKNYFVPHVNSNSARKSGNSNSAKKMWNGLRFEWKEYSYSKFKKTVKSHLLLKYS